MTSRNDKSTVKKGNYDELSLHSHKSTNQSTERSKQIAYKFPVHFQEYATFQALCGLFHLRQHKSPQTEKTLSTYA